jgi:hypothetical protein
MPKLLSHHENTQQAYRANSLGKVTASQIELLPTPHDVSPFDAESRNWRTPPRRIETMRATPYFEERKRGEDTQYTVRLRSQRFQIDGALWKDLRKQGGTLRVQYIKLGDNLSIALSIGKALREAKETEPEFLLRDAWEYLWGERQYLTQQQPSEHEAKLNEAMRRKPKRNRERRTTNNRSIPLELSDRLTPHINTLKAFRMNLEGAITGEQAALLQRLNIKSEGEALPATDNSSSMMSSTPNGFSWVVLALIFIVPLVTGATDNLVVRGTLIVVAIVVIAALIGDYLRKSPQESDDETATVSNPIPIAGKLQPDIRYIEGEPEFERRYGGRQSETIARLEGLSFRMSESLWEELRAIGGTMGVHYIKPIMTPILLSIQPLPLRDVPTEADLEQVIGVSDDGELVYSDDLIDDIPDGDVRRLKAGKDTPL